MSKHTPGPWHVYADADSIVIETEHDLLASWYPPYAKKSRDELLANARLMAAAPDMLVALTVAESCNVVPAVTKMIQEAIAKAEGK